MSFFILGLPRSRTAWMANFMTYDGMFCHHEGINGCSSMGEYQAKIGNDGDSNTGLAMFDFEYYFPEAKKVIIDTDIDRAIKFGLSAFSVDMTDELNALKERLNSLDGLHINLKEINSRLREIWEYLTDKPFNQKRADMLIKLNIQTNNIYDIDIKSMLNLKESVKSCLG